MTFFLDWKQLFIYNFRINNSPTRSNVVLFYPKMYIFFRKIVWKTRLFLRSFRTYNIRPTVVHLVDGLRLCGSINYLLDVQMTAQKRTEMRFSGELGGLAGSWAARYDTILLISYGLDLFCFRCGDGMFSQLEGRIRNLSVRPTSR